MTKAVNAADYYEAHKGEEREYVNVYTAAKVKQGDIVNNSIIRGAADEDGYQLAGAGQEIFVTNAEFEADAVPANDLELPVPKKALTAAQINGMIPVKAGDRLVAGLVHVHHDGALIPADNGTFTGEGGQKYDYWTNFELASTFNNVGGKIGGHQPTVVADATEAPIKGIILKKETTFAFKEGNFTAPAGSILYPNPKDEDGYTVETIEKPNATLRVAPKGPSAG